MLDSSIGVWSFSDSGGSCGSSSSSSPPLDDDPPFEIPVPNKQPIKKIRNVRKSPIHKCAVCGDRPTGYHYDVLSCNGCKTFFRRTVINRRRFVCSRGGNCEFTKDFRCACRACRFAKCVQAGMNPKAIQFPTTTTIEKEEHDSDEHDQELNLVPVLKQIKTEEIDYMMALDTIVHREMAVQSLRGNNLPFNLYPDVPLEKLFEHPCVLGTKRESEDSDPSLQIEMYNKNPVRFWMVADLFLAVEFAKTFTDFQSMGKKDKFEMLSNIGGTIQIITQCYYSALQQTESVTFPDGINALYYQLTKLNRKAYETYFRDCYCRPVDVIRQLDLTLPEFVLFKTIALFSNESNLEAGAQEAIRRKREFLVTIFRKFLLAQYGQRGLEKFAVCLMTIATFIDIAEKRRVYLQAVDALNRCQVSKLAKGIYLKQSIN